MEYVGGSYNVHEHDLVERTDSQLQGELMELHNNLKKVSYSGERLKQVQSRIGCLSFELSERFRENKQEDIALAWMERGN